MTERERLKDLLAHVGNMRIMRHGLEECADYMLANGVIVPPVKLGSIQKVYIPVKGTTVVYETKVYGIGINEDGDMVINPKEYPEDVIWINGFNIGETVFLTREDAEKALEVKT